MKRLKPSLSWQLLILLAVSLVSVFTILFLYTWRLGTLTSGFSSSEITERDSSNSLGEIVNNPINLPHKMIEFLFQSLGHTGAFWLRSVSVIFALTFLVFLFILLKEWFGIFIAFLGTVLFASTPWVILLARNAGADIMLLSPIVVLSCFIWLSRSKKWPKAAWVLLLIAVALSIYTPGIIWFIVLGTIAGYKALMRSYKEISSIYIIIGSVLFFLLITPLIYASINDYNVAKQILLIPQNFPGISEFASSIGWSASSLVLMFRNHVDYTIGRIAVINVAQAAILILGIYAMFRGAKKQTYLLLSFIAIGILAGGIMENPVIVTLCLSAIAIFIGAGLRMLYMKWFRVFPNNPLPRVFAYTLMIVLISLQFIYGYIFTQSAWPHTVETKQTFVLK